MFTGIVKGVGTIVYTEVIPRLLRYRVAFPPALMEGLEVGASVAIDGVCQTVVALVGDEVTFEAIEETLKRTTLAHIQPGDEINIERSARLGDEIGGHLLSGHVVDTVELTDIVNEDNRVVYQFACKPDWISYLFPKGFVALNGCSLTLVDVDAAGSFTVHLIPETLRQTTFAQKQVGDRINLELDAMTQAVVDTVMRMAARY